MASDYPVVKLLRDPIYVEVSIHQRTDPSLELRLDQCWATPSADALLQPQWPLLVNGWVSFLHLCYSPSKKPILTAGYPCLGAPTQETTIRRNWSLSGKPQTCCFLLTTSASAFPPSVLWTRQQSRPLRDRYGASCALQLGSKPPRLSVSTRCHFSAEVALWHWPLVLPQSHQGMPVACVTWVSQSLVS